MGDRMGDRMGDKRILNTNVLKQRGLGEQLSTCFGHLPLQLAPA